MSGRGQDVASQRHAIRHWLDGHKLTVPDSRWFVDRAASGKTLNRPAFKKLQKGVFNGAIKTVVMYSLDRFARTMVDGLVEVDRWQQMQVRMVFVSNAMEIDPKQYAGEVMLKLLVAVQLAMAEAERDRIAVRQRSGIAAARAKKRQARQMHRDGKTKPQIALALGVKLETVQRMLEASPGKLYWGGSKPGTHMNRKCTHERVRQLIRRGLKAEEVARACGVATSTVWRRIRDMDGLDAVRSGAGRAAALGT